MPFGPINVHQIATRFPKHSHPSPQHHHAVVNGTFPPSVPTRHKIPPAYELQIQAPRMTVVGFTFATSSNLVKLLEQVEPQAIIVNNWNIKLNRKNDTHETKRPVLLLTRNLRLRHPLTARPTRSQSCQGHRQHASSIWLTKRTDATFLMDNAHSTTLL